jgi:hypothetical protein
MIKLIDTGLVYRNPQPFRRSIHAWHPTLIVLEDSELLCAFDLATAIENVDYRTYFSHSSDSGQTWSSPTRLFPDEDNRLQRHTVRISRLKDGSLVGMGCRWFLEHEDEDLINRETMGMAPNELILVRSADNGRTWTGPTVVAPPLAGPFEICHAIVELADGRWLYPTSITKNWDGEAPNGVKAVALVSHDQGESWTEHLDVLDSYAQGIIQFESSVIQLPDSRLLAVSWAFDNRIGKSKPLPYAISTDGRTFSEPRPTGLDGETSKLVSLGDDLILCVSRRFDKPGLWATLARIENDEWINLDEAPLWQGADSKMFGERSSADELAALAFGFPQPHLLPDGSVLIVFWCREECIHNIRWLRVQVEG